MSSINLFNGFKNFFNINPGVDNSDRLPEFPQLEILKYLSIGDQLSYSLVSRSFRAVSEKAIIRKEHPP